MKTYNNVSELPVMPKCCGSCPFKEISSTKIKGLMVRQDEVLAQVVINRNLFNSQQICHGAEIGPERIPTHRCRGYFDYAFKLYESLGLDPKNNLINNPVNLPL